MDDVDRHCLICRHCSAHVSFVPAYTKQSSKTPVQAFFRLKVGQRHEPGCQNHAAVQIDILVAESRNIEDAKPILETTSVGKHIFRLNLLTSDVRSSRWAGGVDRPHAEDAQGTNWIPNERLLASYLRSAVGVARLRALVSDRTDVESRIRIRYHDERIPWRDFFFDDERYEQLHQRLSQPGSLRHPVALAVTTKHSREWPSGRWRWLMQCYGDTMATAAKRKPVIPDLVFSQAALWESVHPDQEYVVVSEVEAKETERFRTLVIRIAHPSQVAQLENK